MKQSTICPDCGHDINAHDEYGCCVRCQDDLDDLPGGAQGAHVRACPSQDPDETEDGNEDEINA